MSDVFSFSDGDVNRIAITKRICELIASDSEIRDKFDNKAVLKSEIENLLLAYGFGDTALEAEVLSMMYDARDDVNNLRDQLNLEWANFNKLRLKFRDDLKEKVDDSIADPVIRKWRHRIQLQNTANIHPSFSENNMYPFFAIELSDGCSVGCPFCGIGALGLKGHYLATEENKDEFVGLLKTLQVEFGEDVGVAGFLYWATDPLDNPHYEKFEKLYEDTTGFIPQMTTAIANKNIERVKNIVANDSPSRVVAHRFSVLSRGALKKIFRSFSPLDLLHVEIIPQMRGSLLQKANAGKNFDINGSIQDTPDTIACVSGLLINMVSRELKLVSPCAATAEYPLGYIIHKGYTFETLVQLREAISDIRDWIKSDKISIEDQINLSDEFTFCRADKDVLISKYYRYNFSNNPRRRRILNIISEKERPIQYRELMEKLISENHNPIVVAHEINSLYESGFIKKLGSQSIEC